MIAIRMIFPYLRSTSPRFNAVNTACVRSLAWSLARTPASILSVFTLAQAIAGTPPVSGSAYIQTTNARRGFYVNLGTQAPGGTGPMAQARLSVASLTNFGFDSLGAPVDASGAQLTSRILLTVANSRGTFSRQLEIVSTVFDTLLNTLIQLTVTDVYRGRVMGVYGLSAAGLREFGGMQAGFIAEWAGAPFAIEAGAVVVVLVAFFFFYPQLRRLPDT